MLRVLARPDMPPHTNASKTDIRDYVKVRKISGAARSNLGRQRRYTFESLNKTCRTLGVSFWAHLTDRLTTAGKLPPLADLVRQSAAWAVPRSEKRGRTHLTAYPYTQLTPEPLHA